MCRVLCWSRGGGGSVGRGWLVILGTWIWIWAGSGVGLLRRRGCLGLGCLMLFPQMKMVRRLLEEPMVALETAVTQNGCEISLQHIVFAPIRYWDAHTE